MARGDRGARGVPLLHELLIEVDLLLWLLLAILQKYIVYPVLVTGDGSKKTFYWTTTCPVTINATSNAVGFPILGADAWVTTCPIVVLDVF